MKLNPKHLIVFLLFLFAEHSVAWNTVSSDANIQVTLQWKAVTENPMPNGEVFLHQYFEGATLNEHAIPCYNRVFELPAGVFGAVPQLSIVKTEVVSDLRGLSDLRLFNSEFGVESHTVYRQKKAYTSITICPFRKNSAGNLERLVVFNLSAKAEAASTTARQPLRRTTTSSILNSGDWFKIAVTQTGIFRMGYNYLKNLGVDVDHIDPRNIRIHGSGGGQLPYRNADTRFDDAPENAIYVEGESDGTFGPNDFVLFYGTSQTRWKYNSTTGLFNHSINQYCDTTYYFITAGNVPGKRISQQPGSSLTPTDFVSKFDDYSYHELDEYNLLKSGREWYGDRMDNINNTKSFPVSFLNHQPTDSVYVSGSLLGRSISNGSNYFKVSIDATEVATLNYGVVGTASTDTYANTVTFNSGKPMSINIVSVRFFSSDAGGQGWINFVDVNTRCGLNISGRSQFRFRDSRSVGMNRVAAFSISGATGNHLVWDVTEPTQVFQQTAQIAGGTLTFKAAADQLHEYIAFTPSSGIEPIVAGRMSNQNLHGLSQAEMVIVTYPGFRAQANELADFHRSRGLRVHVLDTREIYNEFSSGAQDVCAIRNLMRMFYDRASNAADAPRYLLLFGDASYDNKYRISGNTNFIPSYQSPGSTTQTQTYISDDFFALLDSAEGNWFTGEVVDLAVGRLPVKSTEEASHAVRKILNYCGNNLSPAVVNQNTVLDDWRNTVAFVGDDQDQNIHFNQIDSLARLVDRRYRNFNIDKIYLDATKQISTPGGQRYPDAHAAIVDRIERGALMMTYIGHGGELGWGHERILEVADINGWKNFQHLAAFLTATCEFSRVDDPERTSAGELVFLNPDGGGSCLWTTSRLAYSSSNFMLCCLFYSHLFERYEGRYPTVGEIFQMTKADDYADPNVRNFLLIGDPAMPLARPLYSVRTTTINGHAVALASDTLKSLRKMTITGEITDSSGNRITSFNGFITPTVYDKSSTYYTLANDPDSRVAQFSAQRNVIYRGKASVTNGTFTFSFVVPKDIQFSYGFGKISYYAQNGVLDAAGYDTSIIVGGLDPNGTADDIGPQVRLFMNDEKFVRGSITDENPEMLAFISDSSGINAVGSGIGHDMIVTLDNKADKTYTVNDYYKNDLNSFQQGKVTYPFKDLTPGPHTLKFRVWDVHNNSAEAFTDFIVAESAQLALDHVMNYPNPFTTSTTFMFEHNHPFTEMDAQVRIFTVSGKLIKTIQGKIFNEGYRSEELKWDGLDDFGDKIGKGVYVYQLKVKAPDGSSADKFEKLVILR